MMVRKKKYLNFPRRARTLSSCNLSSSFLIFCAVVSKPWISCPSSINKDLPPGQSEASVSSKWQEPKSNVEAAQITINPPEISSSYKFPVGETKVTWIASNSMGSANCSIFVTLSGNCTE